MPRARSSVEALARTTNATTTPATKASLPFTAAALTDYLITVNGTWDVNNATSRARFEVSDGTTTFLACGITPHAEEVDRNNNFTYFFIFSNPGASTPKIFTFKYYVDAVTMTLGLADVQLSRIQLLATDKWAPTVDTTPTTTSSSFADRVNLGSNLPAGDWLLLFSGNGIPTVGSSGALDVRGRIGGTSFSNISPIRGAAVGTNEHRPFFGGRYYSGAAAAFDMQWRATGGSTVSLKQGYILALDLSVSEQFQYNEERFPGTITGSTDGTSDVLINELNANCGPVDYLLVELGVVMADMSSGAGNAEIKLLDDGNELDSIIEHGASNSGPYEPERSYGKLRLMQFTQGDHVFQTYARAAQTSAIVRHSDFGLYLLALDFPLATYDVSISDSRAISDATEGDLETDGAISDSLAASDQGFIEYDDEELFEALAEGAGELETEGVAAESISLIDAADFYVGVVGSLSASLPSFISAGAGQLGREELAFPILVHISPTSVWRIDDHILRFAISRRLGAYPDGMQAGVLDIEIDNTDGRFSPLVTSYHQGNFKPGRAIDVLAVYRSPETDLVSSYYLFRGTIDSLSLTPALSGPRQVSISAKDRWAWAQQRDVTTPMLVDYPLSSVMAEVFSVASIDLGLRSFEAMEEVLPFAWFQSRVLHTVMDEVIQQGGYAGFVSRDGIFRIRRPDWDEAVVSVASYDRWHGMTLDMADDDITNDVTFKADPRILVNSIQVVARATEIIEVAGNEQIRFFLDYQDANNNRVAAYDVLSPVSSVDFQAWSTPNSGTGVDRNGFVSVDYTPFGESVLVTIENLLSLEVYFRSLTVRGKPVVTQSPMRVREVNSASIATHGVRATAIESRLFTSRATAVDRVAAILELYADPVVRITQTTIDDIPVVFRLDLSQTVSIYEPHSGLDGQFVILGIAEEMTASDVGWVHTTRLELREARGEGVSEDTALLTEAGEYLLTEDGLTLLVE